MVRKYLTTHVYKYINTQWHYFHEDDICIECKQLRVQQLLKHTLLFLFVCLIIHEECHPLPRVWVRIKSLRL